MSEEIDYNSRENKLAVFTAWLDGKEWQHKSNVQSEWVTGPTGGMGPAFSPYSIYRVKPTPKRVPLEAKDVPLPCWVRTKPDSHGFVMGINPNGIITIRRDFSTIKLDEWTFSELFERNAEYSADRVNWQPCSKESK